MAQSEHIIMRAASDLDLQSLLLLARKASGRRGVVQLFDPHCILNRLHLNAAYLNAVAAFEDGANKSPDASMEMLRFAAFTNSIGMAIDLAGAKSSSDMLIFCSDAALFKRMRRYLKSARPFAGHRKDAANLAARLGIGKGHMGYALLKRMALLRAATNRSSRRGEAAGQLSLMPQA